jgi:hypothetical protein
MQQGRDIPAKVAAELEGLLNGQVLEVLVAEGHDLALGDEARQLVLAGVVELAELDAADLGADGGRQVGDGHLVLGQQVRVGRVGVLAVVIVLEGLERRVLLVGVPGREVVRVLWRSGLAVFRGGWLLDERGELTLAGLAPFFSVSTSNLWYGISLYAPRMVNWAWSLRASRSLTTAAGAGASTSTAAGAIFQLLLLVVMVVSGTWYPENC